MEFIDLIHKRRSIRNFTLQSINDETLKIILSAGMTAPSAMNKQPWEFVIVKDDNLKKEVAKISQYAQMTLQSPVSILVCADIEKAFLDNHYLDCAASIQNMLLAATALGIGSVWTGISKEKGEQKESFKKIFNLPKHIEPIAYIVLGYTEQNFEKRDYFDAKKIHNDKW
jgi:nitroreductase